MYADIVTFVVYALALCFMLRIFYKTLLNTSTPFAKTVTVVEVLLGFPLLAALVAFVTYPMLHGNVPSGTWQTLVFMLGGFPTWLFFLVAIFIEPESAVRNKVFGYVFDALFTETKIPRPKRNSNARA